MFLEGSIRDINPLGFEATKPSTMAIQSTAGFATLSADGNRVRARDTPSLYTFEVNFSGSGGCRVGVVKLILEPGTTEVTPQQ